MRISLSESMSMPVGWVGELNCALRNLGCTSRAGPETHFEIDQCLEEAKTAWSHRYLRCQQRVRECDSVGFKSVKYASWFAPVNGGESRFTRSLNRPDQIRIIAQFRTSSHWLNSEKQRGDGKKGLIPRSERVCKLCKYNQCEDEMHLFECPFYNDIRIRFHRLFSSFVAKKFDNNQSALDLDITVWNLELSDNDMKSLMNGDGSNCFWNDLANFLLACKRKRCQHLNT